MADVIAVLGGAGHQGGGLAQRFARAGAEVIVGSRDPNRAADTVAGWNPGGRAVRVLENVEAARAAGVLVLAVPFASLEALLQEIAPYLRADALVVDVTVPVSFVAGRMTMAAVAEGSAAEHVRARLPAQAKVAGAFKTIPAHLLGELDTPLDCDEFVCGDSDAARAGASALVSLLPGLRPVDVGPLERARAIEQMTMLAIAVNRRHKVHDARFRVVGL